MKRRIFWSLFLLSACVLLLCCGLFIIIYHNGVSEQVHSRIRSEAVRYAKVLDELDSDESQTEFLLAVASFDEDRVTLIAGDGQVLYDNRTEKDTMNNHIDRPEVKAALASGSGEAIRESDTFGDEIFYAAVKTQLGDIIRISKETSGIWGIIDDTVHWVVLAVIAVLVLSLIISRILTTMLIRPFLKLDLEKPLRNRTYAELSPLLGRIDEQNRKIVLQMAELTEKKRELEIVTDNMKEGLVLINHEGHLVLANKSAKRIFGSRKAETYLQLCRKTEFTGAVEKALSNISATAKLNIKNKIYQLYASPIDGSTHKKAAVLFILDITDRDRSEILRREFSANVSHELKTPLSSISAYAELIQIGVAKQEDIADFALQISKESGRLLSLIEDIIRISQLDEGDLNESFAPENLADICLKAVESLKDKADKRNISIDCICEKVTINGISAVLYEMVYNLLDNAVTYNKIGGGAGIILEKDGGNVVLTVWDTGMGIPPEHQDRVFERFYRIDKSHSKETGGTGLGLSIVKHGAVLHKATIALESLEGKGTKVKIIFPL